MRLLRLLLPVLIAMTFIAGGAVRAMPLPAKAEPPCHMQMDGSGAPHEAPAQKSAPPLAMSCCIACLAAPATAGPLPVVLTAPERPRPDVLPSPEGRRPAPDHGPPRTA